MIALKNFFSSQKFFFGRFFENFFSDLYGHVGYQTNPLDLLKPIKRPKKFFEPLSGILPKQKNEFLKMAVGPIQFEIEIKSSSRLTKNKLIQYLNYQTTTRLTRLSPPRFIYKL